MTKMSLEYNGQLRTKLVHKDSNTIILTDAPKDNQGLGESFSPTDMVASALAACIITVLGIQNKVRKLGIKGMRAEVEKHMASNPRRIDAIDVLLEIEITDVDDKKRTLIKNIAETCPVAQSLKLELEQRVIYKFT